MGTKKSCAVVAKGLWGSMGGAVMVSPEAGEGVVGSCGAVAVAVTVSPEAREGVVGSCGAPLPAVVRWRLWRVRAVLVSNCGALAGLSIAMLVPES